LHDRWKEALSCISATADCNAHAKRSHSSGGLAAAGAAEGHSGDPRPTSWTLCAGSIHDSPALCNQGARTVPHTHGAAAALRVYQAPVPRKLIVRTVVACEH
jgi:hypothetical protein